MDVNDVIEFVESHFDFPCEWTFDGTDVGVYMAENYPELCDNCKDVRKCWRVYIEDWVSRKNANGKE